MVIKMSEFGSALNTRASGRLAYDAIMSSTGQLSGRTTFDFDGVDTITNSFADEVFGRMAFDLGIDEMRARTTFANIEPFWARVVRNAIDSRASQFDAAALA